MNLLQSPRWVVMQVTEKCNLRCKMCYEWGKNGAYLKKQKNECHELPIEKIDEIISDLMIYNPHFELFGGEPMMHSQFSEIIKLINRYDCIMDIPTNGTLLTKYADELAQSKINVIWVSMDGPEEFNDIQRGKGVYARAYEGIKALYEYKKKYNKTNPKIGVTMVVTPDNYFKVKDFFCSILDVSMIDLISIEIQLYTSQQPRDLFEKKIAESFGIENTTMADGLVRDLEFFASVDIDNLCAQVNYVRDYYKDSRIKVIGYPKYFTPENIKHFYMGEWDKMIEKRCNCSFPCIYTEIGANGTVTPCHTFYELKMGNIFENSIMEIWNNQNYKKVREVFKKNIFPICYACSRYYS